ncbi:hypothetical protein PENNAL_c0061G02854 [Penicillium nalgiovense]|uniref:Uncharacterized protein n=1 Tax=Penicillium nalgiovense TaxID=60175 RepID=A0A1V6XQW9_PENNA|nr:hypothetical protein PENNAL_c0061G02854 [Penicillium nalgiovense]
MHAQPVAYRQGNDWDILALSLARIENVVADPLALIEILSDPANRAPLEAERALAEGWYHRSQGGNETESTKRPTIPDTPQPPFIVPDGSWRRDNSTRVGDVQLQPLSTMFRGDCAEYGLVVLDISDLESGVKPPPKKEPDIVLISPRPRVPLSILQWLRKYFYYMSLDAGPSLLRLEDRPLVDLLMLQPWTTFGRRSLKIRLELKIRIKHLRKVSSQVSPTVYFWPSKSTTRAKTALTSSPWRLTTSDEPPRDAHIDRAKDTSFTTGSRLTTSHEPPRNARSICLFIFNWVAFRNLTPGLIAAAVESDELRGVSALSLCVDKFKPEGGEGDEGDLGDLAAALARSTALKRLCFLQGPDRDSDNASDRFCTQMLLQGRSSGDLGWLRDKTIYLTCAFSTSTSVTFTSSVVQVFPAMHMFTFVSNQHEDVADADHQDSYYYTMGNTLLDTERFAVRFLSYLRSVGSGSDKAILRFAYRGGGGSSLTTTINHQQRRQVTATIVIVGTIRCGSHSRRILLATTSQQMMSLESDSDDDDVFLRYSFIRIRQTSAEIAPEQQQQRPIPIDNLVEIVGGLTDFLRETR